MQASMASLKLQLVVVM